MKRSVCITVFYSLIKILLVVLLFAIPAAKVVALWLKICFTIIVVLDIIVDFLTLVNCYEIVKAHTDHAKIKWQDRKRTFLGLPWSFTKYSLTNEKLIVDSGFFNTKQSEIRLYRITDLDLERSFGQRLLGLGKITVHSSDKSDSLLILDRIKRPLDVKEIISDAVETERVRKRVSGREIIDDVHMHDHCADDDMDIDDIK